MFVTTPGARIAVQLDGPEQGAPLLLVMGATTSMLGWPQALVAGLMADGFRVIRFDHRDTGLSTCNGPDYAVEDMAADTLAVMDALGLERVHLAGMSLGGLIGQMLAVDAPHRLASLTLIAAEPLGWDGPPLPGIAPAFMDHFAGFPTLDWFDRAAVADFLLGIARLCAGTGAPFDAVAESRTIARVLDRSPDPAAAFRHGALTLARDWTGATRRIALPVQVVHGADDPILPLPNGRALAASIPGAGLTVMDGVGHELPDRALNTLRAVLRRQAGLPEP